MTKAQKTQIIQELKDAIKFIESCRPFTMDDLMDKKRGVNKIKRVIKRLNGDVK